MALFNKCKDHLDSVHESYFEHMGFALYIAWMMLSGAVLAVTHALCPAVFQRSASVRIFKLADLIRERQARSRPQ